VGHVPFKIFSVIVAVCKENEIVGHVPFNISSVISQFLGRDCNKGFAEVTGPRVNRGAGYGHAFTNFMALSHIQIGSWKL
jgi:hypothetical protein